MVFTQRTLGLKVGFVGVKVGALEGLVGAVVGLAMGIEVYGLDVGTRDG